MGTLHVRQSELKEPTLMGTEKITPMWWGHDGVAYRGWSGVVKHKSQEKAGCKDWKIPTLDPISLKETSLWNHKCLLFSKHLQGTTNVARHLDRGKSLSAYSVNKAIIEGGLNPKAQRLIQWDTTGASRTLLEKSEHCKPSIDQPARRSEERVWRRCSGLQLGQWRHMHRCVP